MKQRFLPVSSLFLLAACGGDGAGPAGPARPSGPTGPTAVSLELSTSAASPLEAVFVTFPEPRPSEDVEMEAELDGTGLVVSLVDSVTGAFLVPRIAEGSRELTVPLSAEAVGVATLSVLPPPVIEDPKAVTDETVTRIRARLDAVVAEIQAGALAERGAGDAQAAAIDRWLGEIQGAVDTASPEEIQELALFLENNAEYFSLNDPGGAAPRGASSVLESEADLDAFISWVSREKIRIVGAVGMCAAGTLVTGAVTGGIAGPAAVAVCAGILLGMVTDLTSHVQAYLDRNVFVPVNLALDRVSGGAPARGGAGAERVKSAASVALEHRTPASFVFTSEYRTLDRGDRGSATGLFGILDEIESVWNQIMALVPDDASFASYHLDRVESSRTGTVVPEAETISLANVAGDGVSCSPRNGSGVSVECLNETTDDQGVVLTFEHQNRFGSSSTTVDATVYRPQPAEIVVVSGSGQSSGEGSEFDEPLTVRVTDAWGEAVRDYPVSWSVAGGSGQILEAEEVTDGIGEASARVVAGEEGELTVGVVARDRRGRARTATFSLTAEPGWAEVTLSVPYVSSSYTFQTTWKGYDAIVVACDVTVSAEVTGNTPVRWIREGFTQRDSDDTYTWENSREGTATPPETVLIFDEFQFNYYFTTEFEDPESWTMDYWIEYEAAGEVGRATAGWRCDL